MLTLQTQSDNSYNSVNTLLQCEQRSSASKQHQTLSLVTYGRHDWPTRVAPRPPTQHRR